jgi:RNA polymerase sigma-70 factor (ECF subfamily)
MNGGKPVPIAHADDLFAVSEVLRGDTDAFKAIVERYRGLVYRLALSSLGNREEAEEASQEIFLKAFKSLPSFRIDKRFLPWLYSIASNYLRTHAVRVRRADEKLVRDRQELLPSRPEDNPEARALLRQSLEELRTAVSALAPAVREVVNLYYFEGLSVEDICSVLGLGAENVKSRLMRGRKGLRAALEDRATRERPDGYTHDEGEKERGS